MLWHMLVCHCSPVRVSWSNSCLWSLFQPVAGLVKGPNPSLTEQKGQCGSVCGENGFCRMLSPPRTCFISGATSGGAAPEPSTAGNGGVSFSQ